MIDIDKQIRRTNLYWNGINKKEVKEIIETLVKEQKQLNEYSFFAEQVLNVSPKVCENIKHLIGTEINYCKFYLEYLKEQQENEDFNEWVFIGKEETEKRAKIFQSWEFKNANCLIKSNGKIKAIIEIKEGISSTKIGLCIQNNALLTFCGREEKLFYKNLRITRSINKYVEELKQKAENIFKEKQYPIYCQEKRNFDSLKELLHINTERG